MLKHEIGLLNDEISTLSTKMRVNQDLLNDLRRQQAAAEKREKQSQAELRDQRTQEQSILERLQGAERDLGSARSKVSELETVVRRLETEKKNAIQGLSLSAEAQNTSNAALKGSHRVAFDCPFV